MEDSDRKSSDAEESAGESTDQEEDQGEVYLDTDLKEEPKEGEEATNKVGRKKGQSYRSSYDHGDLKAAYHAVTDDGMAVYAASKKFGVPQSTLRDRVLGRISADVTTSGPPTIFTAEEEAGIARYVRLFLDIGHPLSRYKVRQLAGEYACDLKRRGFCDGRMLSLRWYYKLMDRFPDMQSQRLTFSNSKLQELGYGYYKTLTKIFEEYSLADSPKRIFCLDELHVQRTTNEQSAREEDVVSSSGDVSKISVLACFSVSGKRVPPCFVFPNKGDTPSRKTVTKIQYASIIKYSNNGCVTPKILTEFFLKHFNQYVKVGENTKKHLMFYNSGFVTIPLSLWFWGEAHNILFFPLPLHVKAVLNRTVCLNDVLDLYDIEQKLLQERSPGAVMAITDICKILCRPYANFDSSQFEVSFKLAGIFPLPELNPANLKVEKLINEAKQEIKSKRKRKRKSSTPQGKESKQRKKSPKSKSVTTRDSNKLTLKKVINVNKVEHKYSWTGNAMTDDESIPVNPESENTDNSNYDNNPSVVVRASKSFENGVTLDSESDDTAQGDEGQETFYVYLQGEECVENIPGVVAEEVVIVNTVEV